MAKSPAPTIAPDKNSIGNRFGPFQQRILEIVSSDLKNAYATYIHCTLMQNGEKCHLSQVATALLRLEKKGILISRNQKTGRRPRKVYSFKKSDPRKETPKF